MGKTSLVCEVEMVGAICFGGFRRLGLVGGNLLQKEGVQSGFTFFLLRALGAAPIAIFVD